MHTFSQLPVRCLRAAATRLLPVVAFSLAAASTPRAAEIEYPEPSPGSVDRHEVVRIFSSVHLLPHERASQVVTVFGSAVVDGPVDEQVVAVGGDITLNQDVDGQVVCVLGNVTVGPGVQINDQLVVVGGTLTMDPTARVGGQTVSIPLPGIRPLRTWLTGSLFLGRLYPHDSRVTWEFAAVVLLLNLLVAAVFRRGVDACAGVIERKPAVSLLNGLLALVLLPIVTLLLLATGIGVIALPFLFAGVMFAAMLGGLALYRSCGAQFGLAAVPLLALAVGYALFAVLYALPVVGLLAWCGVVVFGLGTAMTAWGEARRREVRLANGGTPPPPVAPLAPPDETAPAPAGETPGVPESATPGSATAAAAATAAVITAPPPPPPAGPRKRAGFGPRLLATLLDLVFVAVVTASLRAPPLFVFIWFAYHVGMWTWRGTTLGGVILHLRVERIDGRPVDFSVALIRAMASVLSLFAAGLGFLSVTWDPDRQSWHDKIAGTVITHSAHARALVP